MSTPDPDHAKTGRGAGGRGGPEDHLLEDGQEEVFAREEVENGRIEHHVQAGAASGHPSPVGQTDPRPALPAD
jgi:hypothetical protein